MTVHPLVHVRENSFVVNIRKCDMRPHFHPLGKAYSSICKNIITPKYCLAPTQWLPPISEFICHYSSINQDSSDGHTLTTLRAEAVQANRLALITIRTCILGFTGVSQAIL